MFPARGFEARRVGTYLPRCQTPKIANQLTANVGTMYSTLGT